MTLREAHDRGLVATEALRWLGTPYHHHARLHGVGVDCINLLCAVFEKCGLIAPVDPGHYPPDWHLHRSEEVYLQGLADSGAMRVATEAACHGDIAMFRFGRTFSHGGVLVSHNEVVHAYKGAGVILTRLEEAPLQGRELQIWRLGAWAA